MRRIFGTRIFLNGLRSSWWRMYLAFILRECSRWGHYLKKKCPRSKLLSKKLWTVLHGYGVLLGISELVVVFISRICLVGKTIACTMSQNFFFSHLVMQFELPVFLLTYYHVMSRDRIGLKWLLSVCTAHSSACSFRQSCNDASKF